MMPKRLVLVRHGESEGNKAKKMAKAGLKPFTAEFLNRHSSSFRLTDLGQEQAAMAGKWIKENIALPFDVCYTSEYIRAMETAALLDLPNAQWYRDLDLRERDYGFMDLLTPEEKDRCYGKEIKISKKNKLLMPTPGGGESIAQVRMRSWRIFSRLSRVCAGGIAVLCCHGEFIWACRIDLEHIPMEEYRRLDISKHPFDRIHNCQILEYSRIDPITKEEAPYYKWMRSVCPSDLTLSRNEWVPIIRRKFSNEELLAEVAKNPRIIG